MSNEVSRSDVAEMAALLTLRKQHHQRTILFLGARAGALFRSQQFYEILRPFSKRSFTAMSRFEQFTECYKLLRQDQFSDQDRFSILSASLRDVIPINADVCLAGLVKNGFFDVIISTNIDDIVEQALIKAGMRELGDFQVLIPRRGVNLEVIYLQKNISCWLVKVFGDLSSRSYDIMRSNIYMANEEYSHLKRFLEQNLEGDILVIGLDPVWDAGVFTTFPTRGGSYWIVSEEDLAENSLVASTWWGRHIKCIVGGEGSYEGFLNNLCSQFSKEREADNQQFKREKSHEQLIHHDPTHIQQVTPYKGSSTRVTNTPGFEHGYALIIGINRYQNQNLGKLSNAILKDAFDIQTILQSADYCGYARDHVRVLLNDEATADGIREGLRWLARSASSGATALVYFSGHGGRIEIDSQANHYLIPYNCDLADLDGTAISNQELTQLLHDIRASKFLALLDSCYSGGAAQAKGLRAGDKASEEVYFNELAHSQLDQGRGRIIIASSRSEEASHVLAEMDNSLFTHYLLEALRGKTHTRGDGFIRVLDVYEHVAEKVPEHLLQHPIFQATNADNFPIALYLGGKRTANAALIEEKPIPPLYICEHSNKPTQCRLWDQHPSGFFAVDAFPVTQYTPCPHCGHSGPGTLKQVN
jgi:metacaspase-1